MTLMSLSSREQVRAGRERKVGGGEGERDRARRDAWGIASSYVASKLKRREHCCESNETRQRQKATTEDRRQGGEEGEGRGVKAMPQGDGPHAGVVVGVANKASAGNDNSSSKAVNKYKGNCRHAARSNLQLATGKSRSSCHATQLLHAASSD